MSNPEFQFQVPLKSYSTYGIGGPAKRFCTIASEAEALALFHLLEKEKERFIVIGRGSNCLFDDQGFDGTVIYNKMQKIVWGEEGVEVESGYHFSLLGVQASRKGYSGLEFASGIPGSVGGAVYMNAGAGEKETKDPLQRVDFLHLGGEIETFTKETSGFSYRHSIFQEKKGIILRAYFSLARESNAKNRQKELLDYRMHTQPYKAKSCGCVFKNPDGASAGKLIDEAGLKGFSMGDAEVSKLHANFLVNRGKAKSEDILNLISHIQREVEQKFGLFLRPEVKYVPFAEKPFEKI